MLCSPLKKARLPRAACVFSIAVCLTGSSFGDVFLINTDTGVVTRDGQVWDFGGQLTAGGVTNGKATFYLGGDLVLGSGDVLKGVGSRPVSFYVGNEMIVSPAATIDFSAAGSIAGAGGGAGGIGGFGGADGDGGAGDTALQIVHTQNCFHRILSKGAIFAALTSRHAESLSTDHRAASFTASVWIPSRSVHSGDDEPSTTLSHISA